MSKYRPIEFNAQANASEIMSYKELRPEFYAGDDTAYCLDAPNILPSGRVTAAAKRLPVIEYVYREEAAK